MANPSAKLLASRLFSVSRLVAVVTGGGTGIGLMATQALSANGARVYIIGRRKEALENVVKTYGHGIEGQIIAMPGDVRDKSDLQRLAKEIGEKEGGIHILVNNAGIAGPKTKFEGNESGHELGKMHFDNEDFEGWADVFATNVTSVYFTTLAFLPLLQKFTNGGDEAGRAIYERYLTSVITISSISGLVKQSQNHFAYNSSKAATIHLHKMMASEFEHTGIRFNSIAPGVFPSEMTGSEADDKQKVDLSDFDPSSLKVPADRAGSDEDMAATILYFCGRGGQYTSGVTVPLDGGTLLNQ